MPKPNSLKKRRMASVLFIEQDGLCAYCERRMLNPMEFDLKEHLEELSGENGPRWVRVPNLYPTLDHVVPAHEGGSWHISNLVAACWDCNHKKGGWQIPTELAEDRPRMIQLFRSGKIKHYLRSLNAA